MGLTVGYFESSAAHPQKEIPIIYKISRKNDGQLLAEGSIRHAYVDREGKVTKISPVLETTLKTALAPAPKENSP